MRLFGINLAQRVQLKETSADKRRPLTNYQCNVISHVSTNSRIWKFIGVAVKLMQIVIDLAKDFTVKYIEYQLLNGGGGGLAIDQGINDSLT